MLTAQTTAKTHKGEWKLLSDPDVPITEQKAFIRELRGQRVNPDFSTVIYQEIASNGESVKLVFNPASPAPAKPKK